jgi:hypothetical protein
MRQQGKRSCLIPSVQDWENQGVPFDQIASDYLDYIPGSSKKPASSVLGFSPQPVDTIPCRVDGAFPHAGQDPALPGAAVPDQGFGPAERAGPVQALCRYGVPRGPSFESAGAFHPFGFGKAPAFILKGTRSIPGSRQSGSEPRYCCGSPVACIPEL